MNLNRTSRIAAPPERVAAVLVSEELHLGLERDREGVAEAAFAVVSDAPGGRVFELRSREYRRTLTGAIDRSATVASVTRNTWDASTKTLRWSYESGNSDRIRIAGSYRVEPDGAGTRLVYDVTIDARIPLVGGRVAKYIAGEMETSFREQDRRIERLAKAPAS